MGFASGDKLTGRERRKVTIKDLAEHLSLSKGTVSRALNNYPDISKATRERVSAAAAELGYSPTPHARALKTGIVKSAGLVLSVDESNAHKPFLSDFIDGISQTLSRLGWTLTVATADSSDEAIDLQARLIDDHRVDGMILPRTRIDDPRVDWMRDHGAPFVLYGRVRDMTGAAYFDIASDAAMRSAVERLAGLGHDRIAFLGSGDVYFYHQLRLEGFLSGMRKTGRTVHPELVLSNAMFRDQGRAAAEQLLALDAPPTAIVAATDRAALGACEAIRAAGLTVGKDVSIISYDGIPEAEVAPTPLTTFKVDLRHAGERLADLLVRRVMGEPPEALRELAEATLVVRASDGPPSGSPSQIAERLRN